MGKELFFCFGPLSEPLHIQYQKQGYNLKNRNKWKKIVDSTVMLYVQGIITDSTYEKALDKIIKLSKKEATKIDE